MAQIFLLVLVLPLLVVVWDLVVARPQRREQAVTAGTPERTPGAMLRTAAAPVAAPVPAPVAAAPRPAPLSVAPARPRTKRDTGLTPELAQIVAQLSAAYPAPHEG